MHRQVTDQVKDAIARELGKILKMAAGYGISAAELRKILKRLQEKDYG